MVYLCGKSQNTAPLAAVMNGQRGLGGRAPKLLFPLKDTPLLAAGFFIWVAIDKKWRGWHDLIADTYVVSIMQDFPAGGDVEFVASDAGKGWIWVVIWIFLALGTPAGVISSLWFLGPVVNNILRGLN